MTTANGHDDAIRDQAFEQLTWHWEHQIRPGLDGLSDDEYRWEPVEGCWSVRRREEATAPIVGGSGPFVVEFAHPEPVPAPVTTIAWRLAHLIVGVFGARNASHFDGPPMDYFTHDYAGTAAGALDQLDTVYAGWVAGVRTMEPARLWDPVGEAEGPFAAYPYLALVLHINREVIHHTAEILLLRDLYRRMKP
jgi:DinB family protein